MLASFPSPAQLSVVFSTSDGKLGGAWERGYSDVTLLVYVLPFCFIV